MHNTSFRNILILFLCVLVQFELCQVAKCILVCESLLMCCVHCFADLSCVVLYHYYYQKHVYMSYIIYLKNPVIMIIVPGS